MPYSVINTKRFVDLFIAGAGNLASGKDYLNSINVFPVPDGDTGSNMAATMVNAIRASNISGERSLSVVLEEIGLQLRMEAKGNSGIILAEFFYGMFTILKSSSSVGPTAFILAMAGGREAAFTAVAEPKNGTILSTISATVENLNVAQPDITDMNTL